jgi:effector-binding domain-containing protein
MEHKVRLEQLGSRPLAVVRRRARSQELPKVVPDACGTVWGVVRAQQVPGAGRHVAVYWDCQDGQINLEVGVELDTPFAGYGEVIASATPAGLAATTTHYGPYGQLHEAHGAILSWCRSNGYTLAGPSWEIYGHWMDEWNSDPGKIRTDVFYLLIAGGTSAAESDAAPDRRA